MRSILRLASRIVIFAVASACLVQAQQAPTFVSLSIEEPNPQDVPRVGITNKGVNAVNATLDMLIYAGFYPDFVTQDSVRNLPQWAITERYNITAQVTPADRLQLKQMTHAQATDMAKARFRALLAQEFHLRYHLVAKEEAPRPFDSSEKPPIVMVIDNLDRPALPNGTPE